MRIEGPPTLDACGVAVVKVKYPIYGNSLQMTPLLEHMNP